jgi:lipopolysaccharide/colanic/teichoic acid biosynthesis glycosyltransferase
MKKLLFTIILSQFETPRLDHNKAVIRSTQILEPFFMRKIPPWKRTMDIIGAIFGLLFFSPLMLLISLLIKIVSPGPVLFIQERLGFGGKSFQFMKFRTMKVNADTMKHQQYYTQLIRGRLSKAKSKQIMTKLDESNTDIIPFGKILRMTYLDELPQLLNVLSGDMSLVGFRPPIFYEVEEYLRWHNGRFGSVPGMTGLWQVSGKNRLTFREMIQLDVSYARQLSFWLDIKILLMTPIAIISQIMDEFQKKGEVKGDKENV